MPSWKKVIISGSDAALNSLNVTNSLTASGIIYPTTDGTSGQVVITDGNGNLSFSNVENTTISIKNMSGGTIAKGTPCYITGSGTSGNLAGVWPADASNPLRMPAGVIAGETLTAGAEGIGLINGFISGVNTSAFTAGDSVYVAVGGGYTNVKPTGSSVLIQKLGNVEKSHASNGSGVINGPGYYNEVPNIQQGYTWVGNSNGVAVAVATSSIQNVVSSSFASTSSFLNSNTNAFVQSGNSFGTTALLGTNDNQSLALETNGSTKMFISSSGNVGIGITAPASKLHVYQNDTLINQAAGITIEQGGTGNAILQYLQTGAYRWVTGIDNSDGDKFKIGRGNSWVSGQDFTIDTSGNVGIGTSSPESILEVRKDIAGGIGGYLRITNKIDSVTVGHSTAIDMMSGFGGNDGWRLLSKAAGTYGNLQDFIINSSIDGTIAERMCITSAGNVGIGNTSPSYKLDISADNNRARLLGTTGYVLLDLQNNASSFYIGRERSTGGAIIAGSAAYSGVINLQGNYPLYLGTNGVIRTTITGDGNVGIGTTNPSKRLTVIDNSTYQLRLASTDSAYSEAGIFMGSDVSDPYYYGTIKWNQSEQTLKVSSNSASGIGGVVFETSPNTSAPTERMRITSSGNVGIGTTSPASAHKLEVAGRIAAVNSFGDFTALQSSGGTGFRWTLSNNSTFSLQKTTNGFSSVSATPIYIDSSNNVGISTTAPVRALQVGAFSGNPEICIGSGTTGFGSLVFGDGASGNNPWRGFVQYNHATDAMVLGTANAGWLTLTNGGGLGLNVNPTNTAGRFEASNDIVAYSSSDKRWKKNIKNIDSPLEKISQINGVEFDWIEDEPVHGNKGHDIGVIAQEIEQILPDAVQTRESGMKAVKYEKVIPLLIEAIKDQQKQIEELKQLLDGFTR